MKDQGLFSINASHFLRGIAILMVIFSHYFEWGASDIANEKLSSFVASWGDWGVGVFFLLSGYALYKGYGKKDTDLMYIIKRLKNVYIPYLILAAAIALLSDSIHTGHDVADLLTGKDYWFMVILFIIYIAFYFVGKLPEKFRIMIMTAFIIDTSLMLYLKGYREFWYTANWAFALGMMLSKYEQKIVRKEGYLIDIKDVVFTSMGRASLYIYILHSFVYFKIMNTQGLTEVNWYLKLFIQLVITVVVAVVLEFVIRKATDLLMIPVNKYIGLRTKRENM
ncbi:MAG: acyltransferase [Lachnospiraceae bacterium]|nr:acyltransferase [Lachnospiraceae bacterium]